MVWDEWIIATLPFAFLVIVLVLGHFSVWAGAFALSLIMFPIVARTTEESLKITSDSLLALVG